MIEEETILSMNEHVEECGSCAPPEAAKIEMCEEDDLPLEMCDEGDDDYASGGSGSPTEVDDFVDFFFEPEEDHPIKPEGVHPSKMVTLDKYFGLKFYHHDVVLAHRPLGGFCYMFDHGRWFAKDENNHLVVDPKVSVTDLLLNTVVSDSVSKSFAKTTFLRGVSGLSPHFSDFGDVVVSEVDSCKKKCLNFSNVLGNHLLDPQLLAGFNISAAVSDLKFMAPIVIPPNENPNPIVALSETHVDGVQYPMEVPITNELRAPHLVSLTTVRGVRRVEVNKGVKSEKILFSNPCKGGSVRLCRKDGVQIVCDPKHAAYYSRILIPFLPTTPQYAIHKKWEDWREVNNYPLKEREKFRLKREEEVKNLITHVQVYGSGKKEKTIWVLPKILIYAKKPPRQRKGKHPIRSRK
jgi:hypothetical protein